MLARNTVLEHRYRIIRPLGSGGMGRVYEAIDDTIDSIVAIKETVTTSETLRNAFRHEARLLANLKHPALPRVTHHFSHGDGQFLVMEHIEGLNLAERLELRGRPFGYPEVLAWADKLLGALAYLHGQQPEPIIHRDIKPGNIKVTGAGEIYLLDFGLAKGLPGQSSRSLHAFTLPYASLEQLHNSGTTAQSDLYSLGATFYHLLTGEIPAPASLRFESIEDAGSDPLVPARAINPEVPQWLSDVISKLMAVRRRDRFASADEVRQILETNRKHAREAETVPLLSPQPAPPKPTEPSPDDQQKEKQAEPRHVPTIPAPFVPQPLPPAGPAVPTSSSLFVEPKHITRTIIISILTVLVIAGSAALIWKFSQSSKQTVQNGSAANPNQTVAGPGAVANSPQPPTGMVYIPGGEFMMGRDDGDEYERPAHKVSVKPFFIDQYEATCGDLIKFINESGQTAGGMGSYSCFENPDHRVAANEVNWDAANRYCTWVGKRLPTEEEWEFAARGTDGRMYPWGNEWQPYAANAAGASGKPSAGGSYKNGASPFGVYDLSGNVWEWTASNLKAYPGGTLPKQTSTDLRIIRGGAYDSDRKTATTTYRRGYPAHGNYDYSKTGFRCAKDME